MRFRFWYSVGRAGVLMTLRKFSRAALAAQREMQNKLSSMMNILLTILQNRSLFTWCNVFECKSIFWTTTFPSWQIKAALFIICLSLDSADKKRGSKSATVVVKQNLCHDVWAAIGEWRHTLREHKLHGVTNVFLAVTNVKFQQYYLDIIFSNLKLLRMCGSNI